jgi:hypothetical protein
METTVSRLPKRDDGVDSSAPFQRCVVTTWNVPGGPFSAGALAHDSTEGLTYVVNNGSIVSDNLLRVYQGAHPEKIKVGNVFDDHDVDPVMQNARGIALVPISQRTPGHLLLAHLHGNIYSLSTQNGIRHLEHEPRRPWGIRPIITALASDSRGRIAQINDGTCTVYLRTLDVPVAQCECNAWFDADTETVKQISCATCPKPRCRVPTIVAETVCGGVNLSCWRRLVSVAFDSQDTLYVLDLNDQKRERTLVVWSYDSDTTKWTVAADLTWAYRNVLVIPEDPFILVVDAYRQRTFVAHGTYVHMTLLNTSTKDDTTVLLVGDKRLSGRTDGSGNNIRFASLRGCALRTRPLDPAYDIAPVVMAIRTAVAGTRDQYWPPGVADIVEQYARGFGDPAIGLLVSDAGNRAIRQIDFLP